MPRNTKNRTNPTMHELEQEIFRERRDDMIRRVLANHKGSKYVGQLTREQLEAGWADHLTILDSKLNGNETSVQYLLFELGGRSPRIPMIQQLRLTAPPEMIRIVNDLKARGL